MNKIYFITLTVISLIGITFQNEALVKLIKQQNDYFESRLKQIDQQLELNRNQSKEILNKLDSLTNRFNQMNVSFVDTFSKYSVDSLNEVTGKAANVSKGLVDGTMEVVSNLVDGGSEVIGGTLDLGKEVAGDLFNKTLNAKNKLGDAFKDIFG